MSNDNPDMKVLKTSTCKSTSGKATLTYQIGSDPDDEIYLRVHASTGNGIFSDEWISTKDIQAVMEEHPEGTPVTSFILYPLFKKGRSVNTPAFLLAALANEKLMYPMKGKKRSLEPAGDFTEKVTKLLASKGTARSAPKKTSNSTRKKTVSKKAAIKKKAMARKKTV